MVYHDWSDKNVDWEGIADCCNILSDTCSKYGRLGGQVKEKYGTIRFYAQFGWLSLHTLIYPGYHHSRFPAWLFKLDINIISPILQFFFEKPFIKWQEFIYNKAYQMCLKRHPHLRSEILSGADYPELIKGATRREGKNLHILGWDGEILETWSSN